MTSLAYWLSFAALTVYLAVMIHVYRKTREPEYRQRLSRRLAPYHGAIIARAQPEPDDGEPDIVDDWRRLRAMAPPHAQALVSKLERKHLLAQALLNLHENVHPFVDDDTNVVQLHGHSVHAG